MDREVVNEKQWLQARRDVNLVAVSCAPCAKLEGFARRMGWCIPWFSSQGSDFNYDFRVTFRDDEIASGEVDYNFGPSRFTPQEAPGLSVFYRDESGAIYRTYSCHSRGLDMLNDTYHHFDLVPRGRDEQEYPFPMAWLYFQDSYAASEPFADE